MALTPGLRLRLRWRTILRLSPPPPPQFSSDAVTDSISRYSIESRNQVAAAVRDPSESETSANLFHGSQREEIEQVRVDLIKDGLGCLHDVRRRCRDSVGPEFRVSSRMPFLIPFITPDSRNTGQPNHIPAPGLA